MAFTPEKERSGIERRWLEGTERGRKQMWLREPKCSNDDVDRDGEEKRDGEER